MKMKNFYCFIGPKSSVAGGLAGISTQSKALIKLDSVTTDNKKNEVQPKDSPSQFRYLPELSKDVDLER